MVPQIVLYFGYMIYAMDERWRPWEKTLTYLAPEVHGEQVAAEALAKGSANGPAKVAEWSGTVRPQGEKNRPISVWFKLSLDSRVLTALTLSMTPFLTYNGGRNWVLVTCLILLT